MGLIKLLKKTILHPKKILFGLDIEIKTIQLLIKKGKPDFIFNYLGGIGDELLLTSVSHELKKRNSNVRIWQLTPYPDLFLFNPDLFAVFDRKMLYHLSYSNLLKKKLYQERLTYTKPIIPNEFDISPQGHIIVELCKAVGIKGEIEIKPYLFLTDEEIAKGKLLKSQIVINCVGKKSAMFNKQWYRDRFEDVVRKIHKFGIGGPDLQVIQVGDASDPMIAGCVDLRGKTSLRETAAILKNSLALIGTSGLLSHMARAVDCRSVIIYGGREHSYQSGYICNENLDSKVECSPCWLWNNCDHDKKCMKMISVENVISALTRVIDRQKEFLEVEKQSI